MINVINNDVSFKGIKLFNIGSRAKERNFLTEAAESKLIKGQLDALKKHGITLDLVREYDHDSRPTKYIGVYLSHKPDYFTKDGLTPIRNISAKVNNIEDAQILIAQGIAKTINFMKKHFEYSKRAKRLGIE